MTREVRLVLADELGSKAFEAAKKLGLPLTGWIRMAIISYLENEGGQVSRNNAAPGFPGSCAPPEALKTSAQQAKLARVLAFKEESTQHIIENYAAAFGGFYDLLCFLHTRDGKRWARTSVEFKSTMQLEWEDFATEYTKAIRAIADKYDLRDPWKSTMGVELFPQPNAGWKLSYTGDVEKLTALFQRLADLPAGPEDVLAKRLRRYYGEVRAVEWEGHPDDFNRPIE